MDAGELKAHIDRRYGAAYGAYYGRSMPAATPADAFRHIKHGTRAIFIDWDHLVAHPFADYGAGERVVDRHPKLPGASRPASPREIAARIARHVMRLFDTRPSLNTVVFGGNCPPSTLAPYAPPPPTGPAEADADADARDAAQEAVGAFVAALADPDVGRKSTSGRSVIVHFLWPFVGADGRLLPNVVRRHVLGVVDTRLVVDGLYAPDIDTQALWMQRTLRRTAESARQFAIEIHARGWSMLPALLLACDAERDACPRTTVWVDAGAGPHILSVSRLHAAIAAVEKAANGVDAVRAHVCIWALALRHAFWPSRRESGTAPALAALYYFLDSRETSRSARTYGDRVLRGLVREAATDGGGGARLSVNVWAAMRVALLARLTAAGKSGQTLLHHVATRVAFLSAPAFGAEAHAAAWGRFLGENISPDDALHAYMAQMGALDGADKDRMLWESVFTDGMFRAFLANARDAMTGQSARVAALDGCLARPDDTAPYANVFYLALEKVARQRREPMPLLLRKPAAAKWGLGAASSPAPAWPAETAPRALFERAVNAVWVMAFWLAGDDPEFSPAFPPARTAPAETADPLDDVLPVMNYTGKPQLEALLRLSGHVVLRDPDTGAAARLVRAVRVPMSPRIAKIARFGGRDGDGGDGDDDLVLIVQSGRVQPVGVRVPWDPARRIAHARRGTYGVLDLRAPVTPAVPHPHTTTVDGRAFADFIAEQAPRLLELRAGQLAAVLGAAGGRGGAEVIRAMYATAMRMGVVVRPLNAGTRAMPVPQTPAEATATAASGGYIRVFPDLVACFDLALHRELAAQNPRESVLALAPTMAAEARSPDEVLYLLCRRRGTSAGVGGTVDVTAAPRALGEYVPEQALEADAHRGETRVADAYCIVETARRRVQGAEGFYNAVWGCCRPDDAGEEVARLAQDTMRAAATALYYAELTDSIPLRGARVTDAEVLGLLRTDTPVAGTRALVVIPKGRDDLADAEGSTGAAALAAYDRRTLSLLPDVCDAYLPRLYADMQDMWPTVSANAHLFRMAAELGHGALLEWRAALSMYEQLVAMHDAAKFTPADRNPHAMPHVGLEQIRQAAFFTKYGARTSRTWAGEVLEMADVKARDALVRAGDNSEAKSAILQGALRRRIAWLLESVLPTAAGMWVGLDEAPAGGDDMPGALLFFEWREWPRDTVAHYAAHFRSKWAAAGVAGVKIFVITS